MKKLKVLNLYAGIGGNRKSNFSTSGREHNSILSVLQKRKGFDITGLSFGNVEKKKVLRNCVESDLGLHVFNSAFKEKQITLL